MMYFATLNEIDLTKNPDDFLVFGPAGKFSCPFSLRVLPSRLLIRCVQAAFAIVVNLESLRKFRPLR